MDVGRRVSFALCFYVVLFHSVSKLEKRKSIGRERERESGEEWKQKNRAFSRVEIFIKVSARYHAIFRNRRI